MKLNAAQVAVFRKYAGDEDGFAHVATPDERRTMEGVRWSDLNELAQAARIARTGLAESAFVTETLARLLAVAADADAAALRAMPIG